MTALFSCAQTLALKPPIELYKRLMKLITDEYIAKLNPNEAGYEDEKKKFQTAAKQYDNNFEAYGQGVADFSVTSICDFVAMCMMMSAAGVERVEALKKALLGKKESCAVTTEYKDRAYLFRREDGAFGFMDLMDNWISSKANSIVQLKFPANNDLHTFAIEKSHQGNGNRFHIYQGYQNTYSLSHFLGLKSVWDDDALKKFHQDVIWKDEGEIRQKSFENNYQTYWDKVLHNQLNNIDTTVKTFGGRELDEVVIYVSAVELLGSMLDAELDKDLYVLLTGSPTTSKKIESSYMMVLICNDINPDAGPANLEKLNGAPQNVTKYLECGI